MQLRRDEPTCRRSLQSVGSAALALFLVHCAPRAQLISLSLSLSLWKVLDNCHRGRQVRRRLVVHRRDKAHGESELCAQHRHRCNAVATPRVLERLRAANECHDPVFSALSVRDHGGKRDSCAPCTRDTPERDRACLSIGVCRGRVPGGETWPPMMMAIRAD